MTACKRLNKAFTIIELTITLVGSFIVLSGMGFLLSDSGRQWTKTWRQTHASIHVQSDHARLAFDSIVRKSNKNNFTLAQDGSWLEVWYYNSFSSTQTDRYALFFVNNNTLTVEHGTDTSVLNSQDLCDNVSSCVFKKNGNCLQMILLLDNGNDLQQVNCSAFMHN